MKLRTEFTFDSAHRLVGYDGKCANLHGHIWRVVVEIKGDKNYLDSTGILWDFTNRKDIAEVYDHKTILKDCKENGPFIKVIRKETPKGLLLMDTNPTAENIAYDILKLLQGGHPKLRYKVQVYESLNNSAEVYG